MVTLKERHAEARAGIDLIKSLGVNPKDIQPHLYQRFLRNGFDATELPIFRKYDVSFQLNYLKPKEKKNKAFTLESAQTYKLYTRLDFTGSKLKEGFEEVVSDYFGHKALTKDLQVQGLEGEGLTFRWDLVPKVLSEGVYVENNDNVEFKLDFVKGREYKEAVNLLNYL